MPARRFPYAFEGLKARGNADLHITSTQFDELMCLTVLGHTSAVITLHGEDEGAGVFLGGLDCDLGAQIGAALTLQGFDVREHEDPNLQGRDKRNICNRGTSGAGVQLELSRAVRETMFESLTKKGREHPTERFDLFVKTVRRAVGA